MMKATYRTPDAFFVSPTGRRMQRQIKAVLENEKLRGKTTAFIGEIFPFLNAFEQDPPDIVSETRDFEENDLSDFLFTPQSLDVFFLSVLNPSVADSFPRLIKSAFFALKPEGRAFVLIKNSRLFNLLDDCRMPETKSSAIIGRFSENGFSPFLKKGILRLPYSPAAFDKAEDFLFSANIGSGCFSLLGGIKNPPVVEKIENHGSTRMTSASVFTSPRT